MPPRRSSRAPSTKPVSKPAAKAVEKAAAEKKVAAKKAQVEAAKPKPASRKRAASPERDDDPPAKRARASTKAKDDAEPVAKPARKTATKAKPASKAAATKPAPKKTAAKPAPKAVANRALKKAASTGASTSSSTTLAPIGEDDGPEPPASQTPDPESQETTQSEDKPAKTKKAAAPPKPKRVPPPHVQTKPYFNALPTPPEHERPAPVIFAWGAANFGQFGMGPEVLDEYRKPKRSTWIEEAIEEGKFGEKGAGPETIAAGGLHSAMIDEQGKVWTCGVNDDAALGRETVNIPDPNNPGKFLDVDELTSYFQSLDNLYNDGKFRAVRVATGDSITAAVSTEGELRVCGSFRANEGSLGFSAGAKNQYEPIVPPLPLIRRTGDHEKVVSVASGGNHLLVLTTHGNLFAWGASEQGQLGRKVGERHKINGTIPEKVGLRKVVAIGAGAYHSFAVDDKGDVYGWGLNTMGQTGTGYVEAGQSDIVQTPQKVEGLCKSDLGGDYVVEIAGGTHHTLFRTEAGKVYGVGRCDAGQLGLSDDIPAYAEAIEDKSGFISEPTLITFPDEDDPIVQISCGSQCSAAVTEAGALYTWGQGLQGELGVAEDEVRTPRVVVRSEGGSWRALAVSCGGQHTLGLFQKKN